MIASSSSLIVEDCCYAASLDLQDASQGRWIIGMPEHNNFWASHNSVVSEAQEWKDVHPELTSLRDQELVLGFLGRSHLGDVICTSVLPRLLTVERNCIVRSVRHRGIYKVYENNPYLAGYMNEGRLNLSGYVGGPGQMIQKLLLAFGFSVDAFPRGELFLSKEELQWAWALRKKLPRNKPVAIVSTGSLTDNCTVRSKTLAWQRWVDVLVERFTVVQPVVTKLSCLEEIVRVGDGHRDAWEPDPILDNVYVLEDLQAREFFSLFAIADLFLGTSSGGMHVAATMRVPSIIALPASKYRRLPAFPDLAGRGSWRHESFLYPYHTFLLEQ